MYLQFNLILRDVSAFLVDGDYHWGQVSANKSSASANLNFVSFLPVIDNCGAILKLQQVYVHFICHVFSFYVFSVSFFS